MIIKSQTIIIVIIITVVATSVRSAISMIKPVLC